MNKIADTGVKSLDSAELARYSRHILLDEIGVAGQSALKASKVLIVGAGGLGSPVAMYLAAAGVGAIGMADFDTVELHNLQRQLLHGTSDVQRRKTDSARDRLGSINPHVEVHAHEAGSQPSNAVDLFGQYDIVVDGTDNFGTRYLNNDAAYFARRPLVYGSIFKFEGQVSLFDPSASGPCYRCLFPEPPPPGTVPSCGEAGVFGALCGVIGSLQALETIKHICHFGEPLKSELLVVDTLSMSFRKLKIKPDPNCPLCGDNPTITEISAERYEYGCRSEMETDRSQDKEKYPLEIDVLKSKQLIDEQDAVLIDVRESYEVEICSIEGARHVPMNEIPDQLEALPKNKPLIVHCHHGGRSAQIVRYLRERGFENAINMAGGIDSWADHHDPSMQTY